MVVPVRGSAWPMPGSRIVTYGRYLAIPATRSAASLFTAGLRLVQPAKVRPAARAGKGGTSHRPVNETPSLAPVRAKEARAKYQPSIAGMRGA